MLRSGIVLVIGLGTAAALALACGGGRRERPVASLASTDSTTAAFNDLQRRWEMPDGAAPGALIPELEAFLARYPKDGRAPLARAYLCIEQMDANDWPAAEKTLATLRALPAGTTRDLVTVAEARELRHGGQPDAALDMLRPLVGKIVDATIRELFLEEITRDALAAKRDFEAIAYMDAWLRGVGEDKRDAVKGKVVAELAKITDAVLEQTYRAIRANQAMLGYGAEIQRLVAERLAASAVSRGDATLARWLLDSDAGPAFVTGDAGIALGEIATSTRGLTSVAGRTVGLLLPTASVDLRDEAADVARGVAWALELPRTDPNAGDQVRLVTRDDGGDPARTEGALEELAGEGASMLVTAMDTGTADRAIAWGEAHGMPVIALSVPDRAQPAQWGFVLGQSRDAELAAMADDLAARGVPRAAVVASAPTPILEGRGYPGFLPLVPCDVETTRAGEPRFPLADWDKQGARVVVVAGPVECARDVIRELGAANRPMTVALTLEDSSTTARAARVSLLAVGAGVVPVVATRPQDAADPDVRAYMTQFGARPSWWTALGRDAGTLARAAVRELPLDTVSDAARIVQRRAAVLARLARASAHLWTTEKQGFDGAHTITRPLRVIALAPPKP